ncbi:MAG: amidohydrolase [Saprospiraceae bacterium]|nr:amidohydrolase [Saprospiraceae bacterium]
MLEIIKSLRKELHQNPELSGFEVNTARIIKTFIQRNYDTKIIENIGGNGLAVVYDFGKNGKTVVIRCELDALPIEEKNDFPHRSKNKGISHKCGHDGHIAIVAGLVFWIKEQTFQSGRIVLLFQPAEETGKGAFAVCQDERFQGVQADYIFALHNLPNEPLNQIITTPNYFSATVQSFAISLKGRESHASEPENGINPALTISELIGSFAVLNKRNFDDKNFAILTPIHINMGEKSYGISPSLGELHYTVRTWTEVIMADLKRNVETILATISTRNHLEYNINWFEYFPTTVNHNICNEIITNAAKVNNFDLQEKAYPMKFGEDFGWFSQRYKTAMFGLGSGLNTPALHHDDYDFPDEIIETGMKMFQEIIRQSLC